MGTSGSPLDARRKSRFSDGEAPWGFGNLGLGVVGEAGKWVTGSGVVEVFRLRLQELMELL